MPTSSYMPDLTCHIAFDSGFQTPAASRTWTDVSDRVEFEQGFDITTGRQNERSTADANTLSGLVLDNRDGRFTPENTSSTYYPNVKLDRPIRITSDPVDGSAQVEFLGYISDWGVEWEGADGYAKTTISAVSRLARLGGNAGLKSIVEQAILADGPAAYYTLGESEGSTQANDSSGNRADPLVMTGDYPDAPVVFGTATGPGTDGLTAAQFAGTTGGNTSSAQYLSRQMQLTSANFTIETAFLVDAVSAGGMLFGLTTATSELGVYLDTTGHLSALGAAGTVIASTNTFADDTTHHAALTVNGTTWTLYGNGVSVASGVVAAVPTGIYTLTLGWIPPITAVLGTAAGLHGVLAHFELSNSVLTGAQIASHANAMSTGYAGDTTAARFMRYVGYAGIDPLEVDVETTAVTVQHVDTTDKSVVDLMRVMETTEGGVLFDNRDGILKLHNRAHRLTSSAIFTLDMAQQMVESNYAPRLDRTAIANDVSTQDVSGAYTAHLFDATSQLDYGVAPLSIETAAQDDDEPLFQAGWALYKYKSPKMRVATLAVDCLAQVGKTPNCAAVLAANVGDKITVSNRPSQDVSSSASFFVEGYTRAYGPESCVTTFNLSPTSPEDLTYICGHATRGVVGTNPIAL